MASQPAERDRARSLQDVTAKATAGANRSLTPDPRPPIPMHWRRVLLWLLMLLAAWAGLAAWQYREYTNEYQLARETIQRQAESVLSALVGGIRSHRRLGRFFETQLQGALEELAASKDVLAAAVTTAEGHSILSAGDSRFLRITSGIPPGEVWASEGVGFVKEFHLEPDAGPGPHAPDVGPGRGRGWGRAMRWQAEPDPNSVFSQGGHFRAALVLDRTQFDAHVRRACALRLWVVIAGGLILALVAAAWLATVRLVDAQGRTRMLEAETRHLRDFGQAAAGLAHETRNPLGLIRGWTQRLVQSGLAEPERQQAQAIVEECDRVTARINQFLAFAKPCEPKPEPVDLEPLLQELSVLLGPDLEAKKVRLEHTVPKPSPVIRADREMLRQVLFNLVGNALHFNPEGASVEISVHKGENNRVRIEVADRGPGVPTDQVASLFTPYFSTRPGGTGLGLAITARIASAHGWRAGYRPRPGGGSIFWLDGIHG